MKFWIHKEELANLKQHHKLRKRTLHNLGGAGVFFWNVVSEYQAKKGGFIRVEATIRRVKSPKF